MPSRIYTRTGDDGETGLLDGRRVQKDDVRVEALGTVDELSSALGLALALEPPPEVGPVLEEVQRLLFALGAELASPPENNKSYNGLSQDDVTRLEAQIDLFDARMPALKDFVLPHGTPAASAIFLARAICRRAERVIVALRRESKTRLLLVSFTNRLSDLLFVLARFSNHVRGLSDTVRRHDPKG